MKNIIFIIKAFGFFCVAFLVPFSVSATITATLSDTIGDATISYINPVDTAIDRSTDTFYTLMSDGSVSLYDDEGILLSSFSAISSLGETISGIAVHPVSKYVYLASSIGEIKIYDDEGIFVSSYGGATFTGNPKKIAVDANGSYVTSSDDGAIYFFDSSNVFVDSEVLVGAHFIEVEGTTVYVTEEGGSTVFSYTRTGIPITSVSLMFTINSLAILENSAFAIGIATREERNVFIFDTSGLIIDGASNNSLNSIATTEVTSTGLIIVGYDSADVGIVEAFDIAQDISSHLIPRVPPERLSNPSAIALASNGNIFISDIGYSKVNVYNGSGTFLYSFGGYGSGDGKFNTPTDIALDSNNNVYVADRNNNRIQKFSISGTYIRQWPVTEIGGSYSGPSSIAVYNDQIYVTGESGGEQLVQVFSLDGTPLFTFGGSGSDPGQFLNVQKVEARSDGKIFVFDEGQGIRALNHFASDGVFVSKSQEYNDSGAISYPLMSGMAFDSNDNQYFTDSSSRQVIILNSQETQIGLLELNEQDENFFSSPGGIFVSSTKIYVADGSSGSVFVFGYTDDVFYESDNLESGRIILSSGGGSIYKKKEYCSVELFLQNFKKGMRNSEISRIQDFLRKEGVYNGPTTGYFGPLTEAGVRNFQELYKEYILKPLSLTKPTGLWYPATRSQANKILNCTI